MLQLGRTPSHLSLRLRQIMQARRLGLGTLALSGMELSRAAPLGPLPSPLGLCTAPLPPLEEPLSDEPGMVTADGEGGFNAPCGVDSGEDDEERVRGSGSWERFVGADWQRAGRNAPILPARRRERWSGHAKGVGRAGG